MSNELREGGPEWNDVQNCDVQDFDFVWKTRDMGHSVRNMFDVHQFLRDNGPVCLKSAATHMDGHFGLGVACGRCQRLRGRKKGGNVVTDV